MRRCYEEVFEAGSGDGRDASESKDWNLAQLEVAPKLLPTLKFHDLVFGHQLGEGAFSSVKYARHITKVR
jgi:hypothetical protein